MHTATSARPVETPWLTVAQAAAYTHSHPDTIYTLCRSGQLGNQSGGRKGKWLIHRDELDAWIKGHRVSPVDTKGNRRRAS